ncbi:MAG: aldehyde ferredoxin oxidoreductase family protein [Tissierellia bacterium]|nr:aldehyde ferredoxin oxidoreductase family protein [Tissierellia bacterium]
MLYGYIGKLLFVDLTTGAIKEKKLTKDLTENFIGGYGIGAKILYDMIPADADPLGPENVFGFMTGPANNSRAFFGGRYTIVHKSPVTNGWNDANSGGYFGPELKKSGYDALFISGKAEKPVYIYINDGKVEIRDAAHLWGLDCKEVWEALKKETDEKVRISAIGPAGEKLSLISCPINDGHRAPGRGGGGAVMGSKNLKAVAVRGTQKTELAHPEKLMEINKRLTAAFKENPVFGAMQLYGTGLYNTPSALSGDSPVKNWGGVGVSDFGEENAKNIGPEGMEKFKLRRYNCSQCPMGCGAELKVTDGRWPLEDTERPEYETVCSFGTNCLNADTESLFKCNELCNRAGLDTIAAGMTVSWAMECFNNGVLSKEELDGIDLTWGNSEGIVALTEKIANGEGCGQILQHGTEYAAKHYDKGQEYLMTASGIELPMHDPRYAPGLARIYQHDPTPGRHVKGGIGGLHMANAQPGDKYDYKGTGELDLQCAAGTEITNTTGFCIMGAGVGVGGDVINEYMEAITGNPMTAEDAFKIGVRVFTMRHAFNLKAGKKMNDVVISGRPIGHPPLTSGPNKDRDIDNVLLAKNFFEAADWNYETGKPSLEMLQKLGGMEDVIADLYGEGVLA